ncbi:Do family serine endopeptidase [Paralcaligenes sp. KSB-10]|uniref:Do family serine endopeptidase n=1 Tax=Paralcaligenes sp. KSB-10 TaxID=2901142 RepID=UPI001E4C9354|nr:Do family serine endopeptidase [Paralcaligenes sp. KSB-10]UHL65526.1 Do family serine endopeptidase [Paralcaligenes sp. KSB-10]
MFSTLVADSKIRRIMASASVSVLLAFAALGGAHAETAVPTMGLPDFTSVVSKTEGSVVNIRTTEAVPIRAQGVGPNSNDPYDMFRWFFGPDFQMPGAPPSARHRNTPAPKGKERTVPRGVGSGFFISSDGYILTNNHVVADSNGIFVTLTDGKEYKAKVIGTDPRTDVALIKIDAKNMPPLPIGDSNQIKKGQWVLAIGSPFGLDSTVTAGIVSAINRDTGDYLPFIQTDVAVNPGNSGGPLINLAGQVIGINSQIISQSGGFMGISLAIPIDEVMRVVDQLKSHGKVTRGRIGVQIGQVSDDVAKAIGLSKAQGAMVSNVESGGPAAEAGVKPGDVITKFNGKNIAHWTDLPRIVGATRPDSKVSMEVWRKGKTVSLNVKVAELTAAASKSGPDEQQAPKATPTDALGLKVTEVPADVRKKEKLNGGVQVTEVEEPAATAGINVGDVILTVNAVDVTGPEQFAKLVSQLPKTQASALLILRGNETQWVTVTPGK